MDCPPSSSGTTITNTAATSTTTSPTYDAARSKLGKLRREKKRNERVEKRKTLQAHMEEGKEWPACMFFHAKKVGLIVPAVVVQSEAVVDVVVVVEVGIAS